MTEKASFYEKPLWRRLYAFLLAPFLVAAAAVGVFTAVSLLTEDTTSADDLVAALKTGGEHRRWQAAFALTKYLQPSVESQDIGLLRESDEAYATKLRQVKLLLPQILEVWHDPRRSDDEVRRYLALAFGYLGDSRAVDALTPVLDSGDVELVLNSLVALTMIGDVGAADALIGASQRQEPELRSTAAYALGVVGGQSAAERLEALIGDMSPSVRWNAAFGLARLGNPAGEHVIAEILDRGPIYQSVAPNHAQQREQFLNAVRSAGMLKTDELMERLRIIAHSDANLQAREIAKKVLAARDLKD